MDSVNIPFDSHKADLDKKIKNRQRFNAYYEKNKEKFSQKNREQYLKKKEAGFSNDEIKFRKANNRRHYWEAKQKSILNQLLQMKETADEDRRVLIDEIIADNDYSNFRKETLAVLALLMKKKND